MELKIIIPIMVKNGVYWDNFLKRLFCSINSIIKTSDISISIIDTSKEPVYNKLKHLNIDYYHNYLDEEFSRAKTLNAAINYFSAKHYIISDHDIIYRKNYLTDIVNQILYNNIELYVPKVFRATKELYTDNSEEIKEYVLGEAPGNVIFSKKLFLNLYGFNEKYYISGLEDCDFIERAKALRVNILYGTYESSLYSLWHPQWYDSIKYRINKIIYHKFINDYISKGNINWNSYETPNYNTIIKEATNG